MKFSDKVIFKNGYEEDNFVGLKYKKDQINVFLPVGYNKQVFSTDDELSSEQKIDLLLLLKTVALVKSLNNEKTDFGDNIGNNDEVPYNSFIWIISDYFNNGLYQEIDKKYSQKGHGKINWKKTLNSEHYFEDDSVTFINPYYESSIQRSTLITELNNYCLHISFKYIGFLFGKVFLPECNINEESIKDNIQYYMDVINKELSKSFNDRKKTLLTNMKRILMMNFDDSFEVQPTYGTRRYEYAWEKMVNDTLGSKIDISKFFPNAYWNIQGKVEEDKSKLRPDSILLNSNKVYILDAKYYKYGITGNISDLPHTDSIQKQITYGDHISNNPQTYGVEKNNIYNAFILPFNKDEKPFKCDDNIKYMGYANSAWRDKKENYNYEKILLLLIDTKYMIDCFYQREIADLKKLIELIEKLSK
jgi:LlaJI restriction endonuclease.